jgi:hypothetical protein
MKFNFSVNTQFSAGPFLKTKGYSHISDISAPHFLFLWTPPLRQPCPRWGLMAHAIHLQ